MPVERLAAHPNVVADRGHFALQRGPLVYCLEQVDQTAPLDALYFSPEEPNPSACTATPPCSAAGTRSRAPPAWPPRRTGIGACINRCRPRGWSASAPSRTTPGTTAPPAR
jgi:hypothetical protein